MDDLKKVTRLEVIDDFGRVLVLYNIKDIKCSLQDNNRTLKVFIKTTDRTHSTSYYESVF